MWAFLIIDVCDKMPDMFSRFVDVVIVVEMNFFFLKGADESFSISVLLRASAVCHGNLNTIQAEDFRTFFEENSRWFTNKPTTTVCKGCGVSVYTKLQDIKRLKGRYKRKFGKHKIAEGELDAKFGMIQNTPSKEVSHHTWWVPVRAEPWTVFNIIGESKEQ